MGDVAFENRTELEKCRADAGDDDEIYFVIDEIRKVFPQTEFEQKSYCSGILKISR